MSPRVRNAAAAMGLSFISGVLISCGGGMPATTQQGAAAPAQNQPKNYLGGLGVAVERAHSTVAGSIAEANKESNTSAGP